MTSMGEVEAEGRAQYEAWQDAHGISTIEAAQQALAAAEQDVRGDMGEEAVEAGWYDIVRYVADLCNDEVAGELLRRNGL